MMSDQEQREAKIIRHTNGARLSDDEKRIINWLSKRDDYTVDSVCSILNKVQMKSYDQGMSFAYFTMGNRYA